MKTAVAKDLKKCFRKRKLFHIIYFCNKKNISREIQKQREQEKKEIGKREKENNIEIYY